MAAQLAGVYASRKERTVNGQAVQEPLSGTGGDRRTPHSKRTRSDNRTAEHGLGANQLKSCEDLPRCGRVDGTHNWMHCVL